VYRWYWEGQLRGVKLTAGTLRILASAVQEMSVRTVPLRGPSPNPGEPIRKALLLPIEAARQLGVSRSTVYRWFWEGRLAGVKHKDAAIRIAASAVQEKLAAWPKED